MDNEQLIAKLNWLSQNLRLGRVEKITLDGGLPTVHYFAVNVSALDKLKLYNIPFHADYYRITFLNPQHLYDVIQL